MGNLVGPPTYAPLTVMGPDGAQNAINPVWLQWFLQYSAQGNALNNTIATGTYQNVSGSRVIGTTYSTYGASSSRRVVVDVTVQNSGSFISLQVSQNFSIPTFPIYQLDLQNILAANFEVTLSSRIPAGIYYRVLYGGVGSTTLNAWLEW